MISILWYMLAIGVVIVVLGGIIDKEEVKCCGAGMFLAALLIISVTKANVTYTYRNEYINITRFDEDRKAHPNFNILKSLEGYTVKTVDGKLITYPSATIHEVTFNDPPFVQYKVRTRVQDFWGKMYDDNPTVDIVGVNIYVPIVTEKINITKKDN